MPAACLAAGGAPGRAAGDEKVSGQQCLQTVRDPVMKEATLCSYSYPKLLGMFLFFQIKLFPCSKKLPDDNTGGNS